MNNLISGEYNIHLEKNNNTEIINIKNRTTELLKNYINYGAHYTNAEQNMYYQRNNLFEWNPNPKNLGNYVKKLTGMFNYDRWRIMRHSIYLYNTNINIYTESLKGKLGALLPQIEFYDNMIIKDIVIDSVKNKFQLIFRTDNTLIKLMNANKIMFFYHDTGDVNYYNGQYDDKIYVMNAQLSEAELEKPIIISEDTNFFIEYVLTLDYSYLKNPITGIYKGYKYYDLDGILKEKDIEYYIKPDLIVQIENLIEQCNFLEKKFLQKLEYNKNYYKYTDEEYQLVKDKFKTVYWNSESGIYKKIIKFFNVSSDDIELLQKEVNKILIPERLINNHERSYLFTITSIYKDFIAEKFKNYSIEKYILNDSLNVEEKSKLIQFIITDTDSWTQSEITLFNMIPKFRKRNDIAYLNKSLKIAQISYFKDLANLSERNSYYNEIKTTDSDYNNRLVKFIQGVNSYSYHIYDKKNFEHMTKNINLYSINNINISAFNAYPGVAAIKDSKYAYVIYFKEPIFKSINLDISFSVDFELGIK